MTELTPELLERLGYLTTVRDGILVKLDEASGGDPDDDPSSTYHDMLRAVCLEFMDSATALVAAAKERDQLHWKLDNTTALYTSHRNDAAAVAVALGLDGWEHGWPDVAPMIERMRAERDQLRAEVAQTAGTSLGAMRRETAQLRDMLAAAKAEIAELRHPLACRPPEDAGLRVECAQLRLDVERLRAIGLEAVKVLDRVGIVTNLRALIGESPVRDFDPFAPADQLPADVLADVETERLRAEIERKP